MLSAILPAIGMFAGFAASVLAFLAGLRWHGVATSPEQSTTFRDVARFTSAALICAGIAGVILLGNRLG